MVSLLLITCLATGQDCRPHVEAERMSFGECMSQSQQVAAAWASEHPKRKVSRIICTDERRVPYYLGRDQA